MKSFKKTVSDLNHSKEAKKHERRCRRDNELLKVLMFIMNGLGILGSMFYIVLFCFAKSPVGVLEISLLALAISAFTTSIITPIYIVRESRLNYDVKESLAQEYINADEDERIALNKIKLRTFRIIYSVPLYSFDRQSRHLQLEEPWIKHSLICSLITFFYGWWNPTVGPILTIYTIVQNLLGGRKLTIAQIASGKSFA